MIKTKQQYERTLEAANIAKETIKLNVKLLKEKNFIKEEIRDALSPTFCYYNGLLEEIRAYEKVIKGIVEPIFNIENIGEALINLRIARGVTQEELAGRLGISTSAISRSERNDNFSISVEKVQRILDALNIGIELKFIFK